MNASIRSTWRDPVGKPLTDRRISHYERLGVYGEARAASHIIHRCGCGSKKNVAYYKFRYLPKPGYYCLSCLAQHRAARDSEIEQRNKWRALTMQEYV